MSGIACPRCATPASAHPTAEVLCRQCGHRWQRPQTRALAWMVQRGEGDEPIGPIDRIRLREMLYGGELSGRERVRLPGDQGAWTSMLDRPELADILGLLRVQKAQDARIHGWQRSAPAATAPPPTSRPAPTTPAPVPAPAPAAAVVREVVQAAPSAAPPVPTGGLRTGPIIAVGVIVAVIAIVVLAMNLS